MGRSGISGCRVRRGVSALASCAALILLLASPAAAQSVSSSIRGRVTDDSGRGIAGALVQAVDRGSGGARSVETEVDGQFQLLLLKPGVYDVSVDAAGFVHGAARGVDLPLGATIVLNFALRVVLEEHVEVTAQPPVVDPSTVSLGLRVDQETLQSLPLNGRSFTDLALLDSAVRPSAPGIFFGERGSILTLNGAGARANAYLVDGSDNNDFVLGARNNAFYSAEVIQEFQLLSDSYSAEFGRASGGVLNIITRSGTNDFQGSVFTQFTGEAVNGSSEIVDEAPFLDGGQDGLNRQQFGFSVSGPLVRDRAFYIASYEGSRQDDVIGYTGTTRDLVHGGTFLAPGDGNSFFLRTDFQLDQSNYLTARFSYGNGTVDGVNVLAQYTPEAGHSIQEQDFQTALSLKTVFGPSLFNEARLSFSDATSLQTANSERPGVERPGGVFGGNDLNERDQEERHIQFVDNVTWVEGRHALKFGIDVSVVEARIATRFAPNGVFSYTTDRPFEPGDSGLGIRAECGGNPPDCSPNSIGEPGFDDDHDGTVDEAGDGAAGTGVPNVDDDGDGTIDEAADFGTYAQIFRLIEGKPEVTVDDGVVALFLQDDWIVGPDLNLSFGLRYDLETFELDEDFAIASFIANGGAPRDDNNLAPRFGFTWMPTEGRNLVVRGGAGLFYDKVVLGFPSIAAITSGQRLLLGFFQGIGFPFTEDTVEQYGLDFVIREGGLLDISADTLAVRFSTGDTLDTPYTAQWNIGFDRALGDGHVLGVNYVHSRGYHVPLFRDLNPVIGEDPSINGLPVHLDTSVGSIIAIETMGNTWYDALQFRFQDAKGPLRYLISYTFSKSMDEASDPLRDGISIPQDSSNISGDRARSDNDQRHRAVFSATWDTPFWEIRFSPVVTFASGSPFNVTLGVDANICPAAGTPGRYDECIADGFNQERPDGVPRNSGDKTSLAAINAARADLGLAPYTGELEEPGFFQVDLRISRAFGDGPRSLETFLQVFNLLDRDNLGLVDGVVSSPTFGEPLTIVGPPRTIELGLRFGF